MFNSSSWRKDQFVHKTILENLYLRHLVFFFCHWLLISIKGWNLRYKMEVCFFLTRIIQLGYPHLKPWHHLQPTQCSFSTPALDAEPRFCSRGYSANSFPSVCDWPRDAQEIQFIQWDLSRHSLGAASGVVDAIPSSCPGPSSFAFTFRFPPSSCQEHKRDTRTAIATLRVRGNRRNAETSALNQH